MFGDLRLPERFWEKVTPEPNTGCWLWTGHTDVTGFGRIRYGRNNTNKQAHQVAFFVLVATPGEFASRVFHVCDEKSCVNPDHLYAKPIASRVAGKIYKRDPLAGAIVDRQLESNWRLAQAAAARWRRVDNGESRRRHREWLRSNPETKAECILRARFRRYGITEDRFNELLNSQGNACAICFVTIGAPREQVTNAREWRTAIRNCHIDHCHETGTVRGLLCGKCNTGVGQFDDDERRLEAAAAYIRRHKP